VDFGITDKLLIRFPVSGRYWGKMDNNNNKVHQLFIDSKKAYVSVRREVLYNILIESGN
jgi:hypothetical protein